MKKTKTTKTTKRSKKPQTTDLSIIKKALAGKGTIVGPIIKQSRSRKKKPDADLYQDKGIFKLVGDIKKGLITGITYKKTKTTKAITLPCFMGIKPTYYVKDQYLYIIFLIGDEPCNLHRLIFCIEFFDQKQKNFYFYTDSLFDNCKCDNSVQIKAYSSDGGYGDGTWN